MLHIHFMSKEYWTSCASITSEECVQNAMDMLHWKDDQHFMGVKHFQKMY